MKGDAATSEFESAVDGFLAALADVVDAWLGDPPDPARLLKGTEKLQEMNMSFNMAYLKLQQEMQDESRRFTLLSNIMKTKRDTARDSISNVR